MALSQPSAEAARRRRSLPAWPRWAIAAALGWTGVAALAAQLYAMVPPRAGFDLELLLVAGRRVAASASPYEPSMLAGQTPAAVELFYAYPPPVAQYLSLFARVPSPLMLIALAIAAVAGFLAVTVLLWREIGGRGSTADGPVLAVAVLPVLAVAPFVAPFAVALVFGNLDALFPLLYGLMLFGALVPTLAARFAGGAGLAVAGVAKVYPAAMGLWFVVRGLRDRRRGEAAPGGWIVIGSAAAIMLAVVAASVIVGGFSPWSDYVSVLRAGADASFIDSRNIGPAPQLALLTGAGEATARTLAVIVAAVALIVTAGAAWLRDDTLESFGWAAVASLVVLPVTWFHYPVALMPVALVAWMRANAGVRRDVNGLLLAAIGIGVVAVAVPVAGWASVALVLAAVHRGIPATVAADPLAALQRSRVSRDPIPESRG
jgi:hypothetical protein